MRRRTQKDKEFGVKIESALKNRHDNFYHSSQSFRRVLILLIFYLGITTVANLGELWNTELVVKRDFWNKFFEILGPASVIIYLLLLIANPPEGKIEKDRWLWKNGRRLIVAQVVYPIILLISFGLNFEKLSDMSALTSKIIILMSVSLIFFLIYGVILLFVVFKPSKILSNRINVIGTTSFLLQFFPVLLVLMEYQKGRNSVFIYLLMLLILVMVGGHTWFLITKRKLSILQMHSLGVISPLIITELLRSRSKIIEHRIRANDFIKNKYKAEQYAYLKILNEELVREINEHSSFPMLRVILSIFTIVGALILFIFSAIGEGLVQDLFNDRIKEYFCNSLNWFCE